MYFEYGQCHRLVRFCLWRDFSRNRSRLGLIISKNVTLRDIHFVATKLTITMLVVLYFHLTAEPLVSHLAIQAINMKNENIYRTIIAKSGCCSTCESLLTL